jgi:hypothetical protein
MSVLHSFLSQGDSQGNGGLKVIDLLLDLISNGEHVFLSSISELSEDLINYLLTGLKGVLKLWGIELLPWITHP